MRHMHIRMRDDGMGWAIDCYDPGDQWWVGSYRGPYKSIEEAQRFIAKLQHEDKLANVAN